MEGPREGGRGGSKGDWISRYRMSRREVMRVAMSCVGKGVIGACYLLSLSVVPA